MGSILLTALVPLFFVLALGYAAGRYHSFDGDQATGFNTLLVNFALPAMLFASTVAITRSQLLGEAKTVLVFAITYIGLFLLVVAVYHWAMKRKVNEASIAGLLVASSAAPFFGPSVVTPIYGAQAGLMIALAALVINVLQVPLAITLINTGGGASQQGGADQKSGAGQKGDSSHKAGSMLATIWASLKQPVVVAPVIGLVLVLAGVTLPKFLQSAASLMGSATAGVAVFASGLTLAAHKITISREVLLNAIGKLFLLPALVLGLGLAFGIRGPLEAQSVLVSAISSGLIGLILASRYKVNVEEAASTVLLSAAGMAIALPLWIFLLPKK